MDLDAATAAMAALGQSSRLAIYRALVEAGPEGRVAGELATAVGLPGATLSFHLDKLVQAGLVHGAAEGRFVRYRADFEAMNGLVEFLTRNCCGGAVSCAPAARCAPASAA